MLKWLMQKDSFDEKIEIISFKQDVSWMFSCLFKYKEWQVFDNNIKIKISSFKY
jgi:hypothetical protein